jgi:menaquinone-specific isochorismate synthase
MRDSPEFAFIKLRSGLLAIGEGPFERVDPSVAGGYFVVSEFDPYSEPRCYKPTKFEIVSPVAARRQFSAHPHSAMWRGEWQCASREPYNHVFDEFQKRFAAGELDKAVPIIADERYVQKAAAMRSHLAWAVLGVDNNLYPYAWVTKDESLVGASPEILYHLSADGRQVSTVALAASRPPEHEKELLSDEKEIREQRIVRDYLVKCLQPLGEIEEAHPDILTLRNVSHIRQHITCFAKRRISAIELQRILHPTPAVGVSPRGALLARHIEMLSCGHVRRRFGSPLGVVLPDGEAISVVSIRGAELFGDLLRISAGAGILAESVVEKEWQELQLKLRSIREQLCLSNALPSTSISHSSQY